MNDQDIKVLWGTIKNNGTVALNLALNKKQTKAFTTFRYKTNTNCW